jgi:4-hydroxybenzoate polyprenyltransferase
MDHSPRFSLNAWFQLARVANWPSAAGNILAGYLIANGSWEPNSTLAALILVSLCLFASGMILNDWHDLERDREQRPERPLPTGAVSPRWALAAVFALMLTALILSVLLDVNASMAPERLLPFQTTGLCLAIIAAIWLYDVALKRFWFAPLAMGACRGLNFLLGGSQVASDAPESQSSLTVLLLCSLLLAIYVAGVTWMARDESRDGRTISLMAGTLLVLLSLAGYFTIPQILTGTSATVVLSHTKAFQFLTAFLFLSIGYRAILALAPINSWADGGGNSKRSLIILALKSLITLDAALCLLFGGGTILFAVVVISLLPLSLLLARVRSMT